jgi:hypothetical protein
VSTEVDPRTASDSYDPAAEQKSLAKTARIPIKVVAAPTLK